MEFGDLDTLADFVLDVTAALQAEADTAEMTRWSATATVIGAKWEAGLSGSCAPLHKGTVLGGFELAEDATLHDALATWQTEIARARELCADRALTDTGRFMEQDVNLRWIYVHMIEEYARHNGHADLLRERMDGITCV